MAGGDREDFGQQTWWRIFLRTIAQDGSQGRPLTSAPWDFSARTSSSRAYESGGILASQRHERILGRPDYTGSQNTIGNDYPP